MNSENQSPFLSRPATDLTGIDGPGTEEKINASQAHPSQATTHAFGAYLIFANLLLFYLLLKLLPGDSAHASNAGSISLFGATWSPLWPETRFLLLVLIAGALGGFIHTATSFADFVGNRSLVTSWLWWYLLRPLIGSCLAAVVYFAIRAGLITVAQGASALNPFGVVAIAAMSGMFSKQATDKLRELLETLFKSTPPPRRDELEERSAAAPAGSTTGLHDTTAE